ncbi:MAG: acetylxylan esterase [Spirochaetes bacterium]|nr:acetylxylan esterase [Spirochaetota bacterium]
MKYLPRPLAALLFLLPFALLAQEKKEAPWVVKISADRADALYKVGETVKFQVSLLDGAKNPVAGRKIRISIDKEYAPAQSVEIETKETPVEIPASLDRPGFILAACYPFEYEAGKKTVNAYGGAGFEPTRIRPGRACPPDFDAYWASQKARLAKIPLKFRLEPVAVASNNQGKIEAFDVRIDCVNNLPVSGYYARPAKATAKSLPALLSVQGAGVRSSSRQDGRALNGLIAMDINAHGISNGQPAAYYKYIETNVLVGYPSWGNSNRDTTYFNGMFLRVLRALEFLKAQPEWDGKTLIIMGGSQGGAQSIMGAALDPQITACYAYVTAMCNHHGPMGGTKAGWPRWVAFTGFTNATNAANRDAAGYYDMCHFAPRIKAKTYANVGFIDTTCAPSSVYAMFNSITAPKKMAHYIESGHSIPGKAYQDAEADLAEYLKSLK